MPRIFSLHVASKSLMANAMHSAMRVHIGHGQAAGGDGRRAKAQAAGGEWAALLVRNGILVCGDVHLIQAVLQFLAGQFASR